MSATVPNYYIWIDYLFFFPEMVLSLRWFFTKRLTLSYLIAKGDKIGELAVHLVRLGQIDCLVELQDQTQTQVADEKQVLVLLLALWLHQCFGFSRVSYFVLKFIRIGQDDHGSILCVIIYHSLCRTWCPSHGVSGHVKSASTTKYISTKLNFKQLVLF